MASSSKIIESPISSYGTLDVDNSLGHSTSDSSPSSSQAWSFKSSPATPSVSFAEVMSEQLADSLQEKTVKEDTYDENFLPQEKLDIPLSGNIPDVASDFALALILQDDLDREYNDYISEQERQVNRNSKVKLSFNNYRTDDSYAHDIIPEDVYDDSLKQSSVTIEQETKRPRNHKVDGKVVTKHDKEICGRWNAAKIEESFPEEFNSGDVRGMGLQLSNRIYNSLKRHAYSEQRRSQRLHETKEHYTAEHAVDEKTRLILHKLVNRGILTAINGVISVGKESVVLHADGGDVVSEDELNNLVVPNECAIKVFKTTLNEFRTRDIYIKDDYRFKDRFKKLNPRKVIHMWAEKEMHNLMRMQEAEIPCPTVVLLKKHVLVMSFLGLDQRSSPKLKEAVLSSRQKKSAYSQVVNIMKRMYHTCHLVHADLSEYNLLWSNNQVYVIDVSQAVEPNHPHALEFLLRDCRNISKFFNNSGVEDVLEPMQLFNDVSGLGISMETKSMFLSEIERLQGIAEEHSHQGINKSTMLLQQE